MGQFKKGVFAQGHPVRTVDDWRERVDRRVLHCIGGTRDGPTFRSHRDGGAITTVPRATMIRSPGNKRRDSEARVDLLAIHSAMKPWSLNHRASTFRLSPVLTVKTAEDEDKGVSPARSPEMARERPSAW